MNENQDITAAAAPELVELEMQELEALEAPGWGTISVAFSTGVSVGVSIALT
ncbi:daptide-type RiPP [Streptomyces omiyaensis]|uniref:daptide-type RiPP n=1 Tax=Streptomyces omiyaensis TaxID=68247 RepID=UPI001671E206|nr:daptide-type RiPP [Streptomyces omiyaensis]GGY24256.1 hypothetical protein GCM10010363_00440 [Streptomyces omiyaensis]